MTDSPGINDLPPWFASMRKVERELVEARAEIERLQAALVRIRDSRTTAGYHTRQAQALQAIASDTLEQTTTGGSK